jgi:hypothetical protein
MNPITTLLPKAFANPAIQFGASTGPAHKKEGHISRTNDTFVGDLKTNDGNITVRGSNITGEVLTKDGIISVISSTVSGPVATHDGDIKVSQNSNISSVFTKDGSVEIESSSISGSVSTHDGDIQVSKQSKVGSISTKEGDIILDEGSESQGNVVTKDGKILVSNGKVNGSVETLDGLVAIIDSTVNGDVTGKNAIPKIQNSTITGQLTLSASTMNVKHSTVGSIQVEKNTSGNSVSFSTVRSGIFIGGNIIGGNVISGSGIQLGVGSTCNINGYNIQPNSASQTTLTTPEGFIYVNGDKVYGDGPETYAAYKKQNPKAPSFSSPGWQDAGLKEKDKATGAGNPAEPAKPKEPDQVIFLEGNTVIQGDITFEGGNGKVVVGTGSTILGKVIGGIVENQ